MTRPAPKGKRPRRPQTILRELKAEFRPACGTAGDCIADGDPECPINRFDALLRELRRSLKERR